MFNLTNWIITVNISIHLDNEAETFLMYNDYQARITLKQKETYQQMARNLIHEFIHIVKRNSQMIAEDNIKNEEVNTIWRREMEREQLTNAIYILLKDNGTI